MGLACAYGHFVQSVILMFTFLPMFSFTTNLADVYPQCLLQDGVPQRAVPPDHSIEVSPYKCKLLGSTQHLLNLEHDMAGEPALSVSTNPAGDFNLHSWLRAAAPLKYPSCVSSGPHHLYCVTFGFS